LIQFPRKMDLNWI